MNPWTHVIGWTLIHFFWQGALLAIAAQGTLRSCRNRSANTRYAIACVALAAMLAAPIVSARVLMTPGQVIAPVQAACLTQPRRLKSQRLLFAAGRSTMRFRWTRCGAA